MPFFFVDGCEGKGVEQKMLHGHSRQSVPAHSITVRPSFLKSRCLR
jgi:hypothetical protein